MRTESGLGSAVRGAGCCATGMMHGEAAVMANGSVRRIVLGGNEFHVFVAEGEVIERFLNQIGVFVADVTELGGGNAHEENSIAGVTVASGLQPGIVRVAVNFFFQGVKDADPRIRIDTGTSERHFVPEY